MDGRSDSMTIPYSTFDFFLFPFDTKTCGIKQFPDFYSVSSDELS